jgi:hypothetical protein
MDDPRSTRFAARIHAKILWRLSAGAETMNAAAAMIDAGG